MEFLKQHCLFSANPTSVNNIYATNYEVLIVSFSDKDKVVVNIAGFLRASCDKD